jgi:phosphatidylglycerophosphate synthase
VYFAFTGDTVLAVSTLILLGACDVFDGALARALNQFSEFGKKLDWVRDWWCVVWISFLPALFLPKSTLLIFLIIFVFETDTLYLTRCERIGNTAGGFRHLLIKIKALFILALGLLAVLRPDFAGWILVSSLAIVYVTRLLLCHTNKR